MKNPTKDIDTGGPAFPQVYRAPNDRLCGPEGGMFLRDWFAAQAMAALLSRASIAELETTDGYTADECAQDAYIYADAMIRSRKENFPASPAIAGPKLLAACKPVLAEAKEREDYMHDTFNPDYHVTLTLSIAEIRAIHCAVAEAEGTK